MITTRAVTGKILRPDGTPWANAPVRFRLSPGSYTAEAQLPGQMVTERTDDEGTFSTTLWVNAEANTPCTYTCILPDGAEFQFVLAAGAAAVDLAVLREGGTPTPSPQYSTILDAIQPVIDEADAAAATALSQANAASSAAGTASAAAATAIDASEVKLAAPAIAAGALTLPVGTKNLFNVALNANVTALTLDVAGLVGSVRAIWLVLNIGGAFTVAWPASVKWAGGIPPTLTATPGKIDVFTLLTMDGGASWLAFRAGQAF